MNRASEIITEWDARTATSPSAAMIPTPLSRGQATRE